MTGRVGGKVVVVTGAARGRAREARLLAAEGRYRRRRSTWPKRRTRI